MKPVLYDAVTLRHFASVWRMDILEDCYGQRPEPRWTRTVQAEKHRGQFATDDNAAYEFALQRPLLGTENVIDTIDILREAVAMSKTTDIEADQIANDIEATGRHLRRIHPRQRGPDYFTI